MRFLKWILGIAVVLAVGYSAAWFALAGWIDNRVGEILARPSSGQLSCGDRGMSGFPFSMRLDCAELEATNAAGETVKTASFDIASPVTSPGRIVARLEGPLTATNPRGTVRAIWTDMEAVREGGLSSGFSAVRYDLRDLNVTAGPHSVSAGSASLRGEPVDDGALAIELNGTDLAADLPFGMAFDGARLVGAAELAEGYTDLVENRMSLRDALRDGAALDVSNLLLTVPGGGRLAVAGPMELDAEGRLSGVVTVGLAEPQALASWASALGPDIGRAIEGLGQAIAGMGGDGEIGGERLRTVRITLDRGTARLGFIQIGKIPPLAL